MDESDPNALTVEQALERILATTERVTGSEAVALPDALDRILAEPVAARIDVPPARNAAMDGYALAAADGDAGSRLRIAGISAAGHPWDGALGAGECIRILTGAVVPDSADTVVMQEHVTVDGDHITLATDARRGANVRNPGEDTRAGTVILDTGRRLTPADIGLLASQGIGEVPVVRRPRVAFFTTGDELAPIGQPLKPGQIHDSNRHTLRALLSRYPVVFEDLGVIADTEEAVRSALTRAGESADLILTTGGVSVGDADFVTRLLQREGEVGFWKVAMKPGRPLAFGRFGQALFLGLPGNPVSAMATFSLFVRPALLRLCGTEPAPPWTLRARLLENLRKHSGRTDFQRGVLERRDGEWVVRSTGGQGSHQLRSMSLANAYIVLPRESRGAEAGEQVDVIPFHSVF
ncbi:Molybdopterin biosynthesis protein MoeA [Thioalkalivibrio nitratireducens DSM 14787]|uniref:Molybdopterin molybdenumtransferase n=1 Tax=Thioalkalivibrio nitratireducens (strain DSM 14787 / UNIQEM 213 / ALEN2) TaxID=1255043 RepID=L0DZQ6_THIND|nr:Molybdopterin biosynthesis protein MoeA [Thioalkalivibrio nitratireducens DSM 14787]